MQKMLCIFYFLFVMSCFCAVISASNATETPTEVEDGDENDYKPPPRIEKIWKSDLSLWVSFFGDDYDSMIRKIRQQEDEASSGESKNWNMTGYPQFFVNVDHFKYFVTTFAKATIALLEAMKAVHVNAPDEELVLLAKKLTREVRKVPLDTVFRGFPDSWFISEKNIEKLQKVLTTMPLYQKKDYYYYEFRKTHFHLWCLFTNLMAPRNIRKPPLEMRIKECLCDLWSLQDGTSMVLLLERPLLTLFESLRSEDTTREVFRDYALLINGLKQHELRNLTDIIEHHDDLKQKFAESPRLSAMLHVQREIAACTGCTGFEGFTPFRQPWMLFLPWISPSNATSIVYLIGLLFQHPLADLFYNSRISLKNIEAFQSLMKWEENAEIFEKILRSEEGLISDLDLSKIKESSEFAYDVLFLTNQLIRQLYRRDGFSDKADRFIQKEFTAPLTLDTYWWWFTPNITWNATAGPEVFARTQSVMDHYKALSADTKKELIRRFPIINLHWLVWFSPDS